MIPPTTTGIGRVLAQRTAMRQASPAAQAAAQDAAMGCASLRRVGLRLCGRIASPALRRGGLNTGLHLRAAPVADERHSVQDADATQAMPAATARGRERADRRFSPVGATTIQGLAIELGYKTTTQRGSIPCANLSFFRFFSHPLPAACRIRFPAGPAVRSPVRSSPMRRGAMPSPARSSVAWLVQRPAASTLACRLAVRATDLTAACGQRHHPWTAIRGRSPRVAVGISAPLRT